MNALTKLMLLALLSPVMAMFGPRAEASMLFTFQRISDSQAIMTASGTPDTGFPTGVNIGNFSGIVFDGVAQGFFGAAVDSGDFVFGSIRVDGYAVDNFAMLSDFVTFFDDTTATGTAILTLQGPADWAPIGTSNRVLSDYICNSAGCSSQTDVQIGTWEMVAPVDVPLPATAWLLMGGLALGAVARKSRAA